MNESLELIQVLKNTPTWVWLVFLYLIITGILAATERVIHIVRLFIFPCIFVFLFIFKLVSEHTVKLRGICILLLIISCAFPLICGRERKITKIKKYYVTIRGSYSNLLISILIFSTKYFFFIHEGYWLLLRSLCCNRKYNLQCINGNFCWYIVTAFG